MFILKKGRLWGLVIRVYTLLFIIIFIMGLLDIGTYIMVFLYIQLIFMNNNISICELDNIIYNKKSLEVFM